MCVVRGDHRPSLLNLSPGLKDVLAKAWAKDPAKRGDAATLADGLTEALIKVRFGDLAA